MALEHAWTDDAGTPRRPGEDESWDLWIAATATRAFLLQDPILDWLDLHGRSQGHLPDHEQPGFDPRTDFLRFVADRATAFRERVVDHLRSLAEVRTICTGPQDARRRDAVERSFDAMRAGVEILDRPALWDAESRTYGIPDLLVRADVVPRLFPTAIPPAEAAIPAPDLGLDTHYRAVGVEYATLELLKDGSLAASMLGDAARVWIHNRALGRLQGHRPSTAHLLGRSWEQDGMGANHAMSRLAPVPDAATFGRARTPLADRIADAFAWLRRLRAAGATWCAVPIPTVPELHPNISNRRDQPWHRAKAAIADRIAELTRVAGVSAERRDRALTRGIFRSDDQRATAASMFARPGDTAGRVDAILRANRSPADGRIVFPNRVTDRQDLWRIPAPAEFHVGFESVGDLDDDFSTFPERGGRPLIFVVGCGWRTDPREPSTWTFRRYAVDRLTAADEGRILDAWFADMAATAAGQGVTLRDARVFHWSPADGPGLDGAFNAAAVRHGQRWPDPPQWIDLRKSVFMAQPVTVRGAHDFGLTAIAKAMHAAGRISTSRDAGPTDGLGAMVGAWWCEAEAGRRGGSMRDLDLMREIAAHREVDCRVMTEILAWLRANR
jgi:hypothetical protein